MRSLFAFIRTVRSFGRDKCMMAAMVKKRWGTCTSALFNLDDFMAYSFPPIKDWMLLSCQVRRRRRPWPPGY